MVREGTGKRMREECAGGGEASSTTGSSGEGGCLAHPDSARLPPAGCGVSV